MRIWFHGTNTTAAAKILYEGFASGTYFAEHLEDALEFGGDHVFMVALTYESAKDGNWQMCVHEPVPISTIVRLTHYGQHIIASYPDRLTAVFEANKPATPPL